MIAAGSRSHRVYLKLMEQSDSPIRQSSIDILHSKGGYNFLVVHYNERQFFISIESYVIMNQ